MIMSYMTNILLMTIKWIELQRKQTQVKIHTMDVQSGWFITKQSYICATVYK